MSQSTLFLIVGPSGTGKTSVLEALLKRQLLGRVVSHSTRPMRPGESFGNPYYFISNHEFAQLEETNSFVEQVVYNGNRYGFTRAEVEWGLQQGNIGLIVEGHGAEQFAKLFPGRTRVIFLLPPSENELVRRMQGRGNTESEISDRLALMSEEMRFLHLADWQVKTDRPLNDVIADVAHIIESAK